MLFSLLLFSDICLYSSYFLLVYVMCFALHGFSFLWMFASVPFVLLIFVHVRVPFSCIVYSSLPLLFASLHLLFFDVPVCYFIVVFAWLWCYVLSFLCHVIFVGLVCVALLCVYFVSCRFLSPLQICVFCYLRLCYDSLFAGSCMLLLVFFIFINLC